MNKTASLLQGVNFQLPLGGHFYTADNNLKFISGKDNVDHHYIVEALLQFYLIETTKRPRVRVAADLHKAAQFAYRRMRRHKEALCDEYEALAERLLDALN